MIYFIKSPNGLIEIGTSLRLSQHLRQLRTEHGQGLEVLAVMEGNRDQERVLCHRFQHLNVVNEWFEPGEDLMGFIKAEGQAVNGTEDGPSILAVEMDDTIIKDCRTAAACLGMSLAKYLSETMRVIARQEINECAEVSAESAEASPDEAEGR